MKFRRSVTVRRQYIKLHLNNGMAKIISIFAESGCVQEALLDENGEILELVPFDETTNYQEYNSRYRYKISYPESVKTTLIGIYLLV